MTDELIKRTKQPLQKTETRDPTQAGVDALADMLKVNVTLFRLECAAAPRAPAPGHTRGGGGGGAGAGGGCHRDTCRRAQRVEELRLDVEDGRAL